MTTFYICRHGQTENNKNRLLSGWIDTPLTAEGVQNAHASAAKLQAIAFDHIVSSDLGRAFITAYIISRELNYGGEIERCSDLREVNYGQLANTPYAGEGVVYPSLSALENAEFIPPNGESLAQMQDRIIGLVDTLAESRPGETILLVGHDGTINALYAHFAKRNIGIVDAERNNSHDIAVKFIYDRDVITTFEEIVSSF